MKFNIRTLGLLTCAAAMAAICTAALVAKMDHPGVAIGKEGMAQATELVVAKTQTKAGQIGQFDGIAQLAIVKEYSAPVASSIASKDALANAPNTATSVQVALNAAKITDQLALKITASAAKYAFATTGESVQSGTS